MTSTARDQEGYSDPTRRPARASRVRLITDRGSQNAPALPPQGSAGAVLCFEDRRCQLSANRACVHVVPRFADGSKDAPT
jgi:hypothetical protein